LNQYLFNAYFEKKVERIRGLEDYIGKKNSQKFEKKKKSSQSLTGKENLKRKVIVE